MEKLQEIYAIPRRLGNGEDGVGTFLKLVEDKGFRVVKHTNEDSYAVYRDERSYNPLGLINSFNKNWSVRVCEINTDFHGFVSNLELK